MATVARPRSKKPMPVAIQARVSQEHLDYLQAQVQEDEFTSLSAALRQAILKAQILDRLAREGLLPQDAYGEPDDEPDLSGHDRDELARLHDA